MSSIQFVVPVQTGGEDSKLTRSVRVTVEARDDRGALAVGGIPTMVYRVENAEPTVTLRPPLSATIGVPLELFARYGDVDDDLGSFMPLWSFLPPGPVSEPEDLQDIPKVADGSTHFIVGKRFTPLSAGPWRVRVGIVDPLGASATTDLDFTVSADQPPCIAQWSPIVPPESAALPLTAPTLFQIPVVNDELDSYPRRSDAATFGTATFAWSIRVPGDERRVLAGATSNSVELDPRTFRLGDIVELRVEVFDRNLTPTVCDEEEPTCATPSASCLQRQTWRLEVR